MKKALAMALGAMLVTGAAAPALAASQVDFSGYYRAIFANDWNQNRGTSRDKISDSYFVSRLNLDFVFQATDEVSVYWTLRGLNEQRWGAGSTAAETYHAYGEVKQDWGTVSIGRLTDAYSYLGLDTLGWNPGGTNDVFTNWGVFDFDAVWDGIRYANRWDNGFQLVAQFNRLGTAQMTGGDEQTADLFVLQPSYHWEDGGASLALMYMRDHVNVDDNDLPHPDKPALKAYYINPAFAHSFGDYSVHFEGKAGWGKQEEAGQEIKHNGYALYLDFDYNYGPGNVNLAGWWVSGTKAGADKSNSLVDFGDGFGPFIVAYDMAWSNDGKEGAVNAANARSAATISKGEDWDGGGGANHWAVALTGSHGFTDDLTLKYGLARLALNRVAPGAKKDIGWEADLGLEVNLLDNLEFRTTAGYLFAGDALKVGDESAADSYAWYNTLVFSF